MIICPACGGELADDDARFCGLCGFRLAPISADDHRALTARLSSMGEAEQAVLLTRRKGVEPSSMASSPAAVRPVEANEVVELRAVRRTAAQGQAAPARPLPAEASAATPVKREAQRFPLRVNVTYTSEHNFYAGFVQNVSSGGLFVATHQPVEIGQLIELTFTVPGLNHACTTTCEVRWVREYDSLNTDVVPGMGLRFSQLDAEARAAIELFIRHREPIFFDDEPS